MELLRDCKRCHMDTAERKILFNGKTGMMDVWFECTCGNKGPVASALELTGSSVIQAIEKWNEEQRQ